MATEISVIVLAFNEAANLEPAIREIAAALVTTGVSNEILIVDDGSTDGTGSIADRLAARNPDVRVVHHPVNGGLGAGYRTGFVEAQGEFVTFFAADGEIPATVIPEFFRRMSDADMVLGYLPQRKSSLTAKGLSAAERLLFYLLFGSFPKFQGVFMFRRSLLNRFELTSRGRGWTVVMELIIRASRAGSRIVSVPTQMRPRMSGKSKVKNLHTVFDSLRQVLALRCRLGRRRSGLPASSIENPSRL